jgi:hypothetical protein
MNFLAIALDFALFVLLIELLELALDFLHQRHNLHGPHVQSEATPPLHSYTQQTGILTA